MAWTRERPSPLPTPLASRNVDQQPGNGGPTFSSLRQCLSELLINGITGYPTDSPLSIYQRYEAIRCAHLCIRVVARCLARCYLLDIHGVGSIREILFVIALHIYRKEKNYLANRAVKGYSFLSAEAGRGCNLAGNEGIGVRPRRERKGAASATVRATIRRNYTALAL